MHLLQKWVELRLLSHNLCLEFPDFYVFRPNFYKRFIQLPYNVHPP